MTINAAAPHATDLPANTPPTSSNTTSSTDRAQKTDTLTPDIAKQQLNASILQASLDISLSSQNDPLALLYKTAIDNLNDILRPELGDNAIQNASTEDNSPEATAGRIVSFIQNIYQLYRQHHPDDDETSAVDNFLALIQVGIDQGFEEARHILSSLNVLNGEIASNIDKTYELVKTGLADFAASKKTPPTETDTTHQMTVTA